MNALTAIKTLLAHAMSSQLCVKWGMSFGKSYFSYAEAHPAENVRDGYMQSTVTLLAWIAQFGHH